MNKPSLVEFPVDGVDGWTDTHEGGLFVMVVVPAPLEVERAWAACHVDVTIGLSLPDVCVTQGAREFWPTGTELNELWEEERVIREALEKAGETELAARSFAHRSSYEQSREFLAALHIGSTGGSMWSDRLGRFFEAAPETLTPEGRTLLDALRVAYGVEPVLVTFLDT